MSYTKMNAEIKKYLKANNLPWQGTSKDSEEKTQQRLSAYRQGRDFVFRQWLEEKRYKELISCAHGGWFSKDEFLYPLSQHFAKTRELLYLQVLFEKGIKLYIENTLTSLNFALEDNPMRSVELFLKKEIDDFPSNEYNSIVNFLNYKNKALIEIDVYISCLKFADCEGDYLEKVMQLKEKLINMTIRKKDLKFMNNKLPKI